MYTSFPDEMSVVVPQPSVPRYCAMVVVKPPELEQIATDPLSSTSSGLSPPSAPPIRTRFQESATPRQFAPKMSMPLAWPSARISRASCTAIFSVIITILRRSGFTRMSSATPSRTPDGGRIDDAGVEGDSVIEAFAHVVVDRNVAG